MSDAEHKDPLRRRETCHRKSGRESFGWRSSNHGQYDIFQTFKVASDTLQRSIQGNPYVKNYEFNFDFGPPWGNRSVVMTSVLGHLTGLDFDQNYRSWTSCPPSQLFEADTRITIDQSKQSLAENIQQQARHAQKLFIWTDCDREGEHIGGEVRDQAKKGNPRIEVKRAKFSNTERA